MCRHKNIKDLAEEIIQNEFAKGVQKDLCKSLPLAYKLNCSIDLATGTEKLCNVWYCSNNVM